MPRLADAGTFALVLLLTALLAVWGAFLVPLRVHGHAVPVGVLVALTNVPLCRAGAAALQRRAGAAVPMAVWAGIAVLFSSERSEGDLVITGSYRGLAFLLVGLLSAAIAVGAWRPVRLDVPPAVTAAPRGAGARRRARRGAAGPG